MKKLLACLMLLITLTGCTSNTEFGRCVGINGVKDPSLVYEYNGLNIFWAVAFSETVIVPLIVVLSELECPVAKK